MSGRRSRAPGRFRPRKTDPPSSAAPALPLNSTRRAPRPRSGRGGLTMPPATGLISGDHKGRAHAKNHPPRRDRASADRRERCAEGQHARRPHDADRRRLRRRPGSDGAGLPLLVDLVGFTAGGPAHTNWAGFPRERAGAARPADRRGADAAGRRRLPGLLHPRRRQPVHQLGRHRPLGGFPDHRAPRRRRGPLRLRRARAARRLRQELGRLRRDRARARPRRRLGGGRLPFRRHGLRALLPARHARHAARPRPRRGLARDLVEEVRGRAQDARALVQGVEHPGHGRPLRPRSRRRSSACGCR